MIAKLYIIFKFLSILIHSFSFIYALKFKWKRFDLSKWKKEMKQKQRRQKYLNIKSFESITTTKKKKISQWRQTTWKNKIDSISTMNENGFDWKCQFHEHKASHYACNIFKPFRYNVSVSVYINCLNSFNFTHSRDNKINCHSNPLAFEKFIISNLLRFNFFNFLIYFFFFFCSQMTSIDLYVFLYVRTWSIKIESKSSKINRQQLSISFQVSSHRVTVNCLIWPNRIAVKQQTKIMVTWLTIYLVATERSTFT